MRREAVKNRFSLPPARYKKRRVRANWKHWQAGEAPAVVRGTNRRVVVVKSPDPRIFEEAIFVLREDVFRRDNSAEKVLQEAQRAAGAYLRRSAPKKRPFFRLPAPVYAAAGAAAAGIAWLALHFVGV